MPRAGMLRAAARSRRGAPGLLLMTTEISALGMRPAETLSARASKLEPRALRRTPMRWVINRERYHRCGERRNLWREEGDLTQSSLRKGAEIAGKVRKRQEHGPGSVGQT